MAVETQVATTALPSTLSVGSAKTFLIAHPIVIAIIGGALVGVATYYLVKKIAQPAEGAAA
jgi:asparagine N-glycosylation enzyme membrane subunit Stt3